MFIMHSTNTDPVLRCASHHCRTYADLAVSEPAMSLPSQSLLCTSASTCVRLPPRHLGSIRH